MKIKLGQITKIKTGKLDANASSEDGKYPFFTCSKEPLRIDSYSYDCECVLVAGNGDLNVKYFNGKFDAYQRTYIIEDDSNGKLYMPYLYYFLSGYVEVLRQQSIGGVIKYIKLGNLTDAYIELCSVEEQKKIVEVLKKAEEILNKRIQQVNYLDELIKSRFIEMFELHSWDTVLASSIMHGIRNGVSPSTKGEHYEKVLTLSAITRGVFDANSCKDGLFEGCPSMEKRVSTSDFYMCRGNGNKALVGVGAYSTEDRPDLVFPDTVIAAYVDEKKVCLPFLCNAWKRPVVRKQIEAGARTTNGTYKINQRVISNIEIILPPLSLQYEFAEFVQQVDKQKFNLQQNLKELEDLYASLMQKAFSGDYT